MDVLLTRDIVFLEFTLSDFDGDFTFCLDIFFLLSPGIVERNDSKFKNKKKMETKKKSFFNTLNVKQNNFNCQLDPMETINAENFKRYSVSISENKSFFFNRRNQPFMLFLSHSLTKIPSKTVDEDDESDNRACFL